MTIIYYDYDYYSNRAGEYASFRSALFIQPMVRRMSFKHYNNNIIVIDRYTPPGLPIICFHVPSNRIPSARDIVICFVRFLYTGKMTRVIAYQIVITYSQSTYAIFGRKSKCTSSGIVCCRHRDVVGRTLQRGGTSRKRGAQNYCVTINHRRELDVYT